MTLTTRCPECNRKLTWDVAPAATEIRHHTCAAPSAKYQMKWTVKIHPAVEREGRLYSRIEWISVKAKSEHPNADDAGFIYGAKHAVVYDSVEQGVDAGSKYAVVCEHGNLVTDDSLVRAKQSARWPWNFCEKCRVFEEEAA